MQLDERDRIGGPPPRQWAGGPIVGLILIALVAGGLYFYRDIAGYLNFGRHAVASSLGGSGAGDYEAVYKHLGIAPLDANVAYQDNVEAALGKLKAEPCDKTGIYDLSRALEQAGEARNSAQALEGFAAACKNAEGELYRAADLYYGLGDYDKTIALGDQLIKANPYNGQIQYLRGQASNAKEQWADALPFYINAVELFGSPKNVNSTVFFQLANIYDRLGRSCDAITAIETWVLVDPAGRDTTQTKKMVDDFSAKGKCDTDTAKGTDRFPKPANGVILVKAQVNDTPGTFIVDTGASYVDLTEDFARKAGVAITHAGAATIQTANGQISADLGTADSVRLGHAQASKIALVVQKPSLGRGVDGLIGMSFLARFDVTLTDRELSLKAKAIR
jgi:clan AA aspartic protease (TIGR02281 family)